MMLILQFFTKLINVFSSQLFLLHWKNNHLSLFWQLYKLVKKIIIKLRLCISFITERKYLTEILSRSEMDIKNSNTPTIRGGLRSFFQRDQVSLSHRILSGYKIQLIQLNVSSQSLSSTVTGCYRSTGMHNGRRKKKSVTEMEKAGEKKISTIRLVFTLLYRLAFWMLPFTDIKNKQANKTQEHFHKKL